MSSWEKAITRLLGLARLHRIKSKIIAFSLIATLVPCLGMGWLSYRNNRSVLSQKISEELTGLTSHAARAFDLWLEQRCLDVRVFASSYEVSENLEQLSGKGVNRARRARSLHRLQAYLESVAEKFEDYAEFVVLDRQGNPVYGHIGRAGTVGIPPDSLEIASGSEPAFLGSHWDEGREAGVLIVAQPVRAGHQHVVGFLAAKVELANLAPLLRRQTRDQAIELYFIDAVGAVLASSRTLTEEYRSRRLDAAAARELLASPATLLEFESFSGDPSVGALEPLDGLGWGVVAQMDRAAAFAQIARLRNMTLLLILAVLLGVGLAAYILGSTIVRPLDRLTRGAGNVGAGDLAVDLPVLEKLSEVGYLTEVFNQMVARLRWTRDELAASNQALREKNRQLHEMSITDELTGVFNRRYLARVMSNELERSRRYGHPLSILMIDIDHFKAYNDKHGHLAGDEALVGVSECLRETIRASDYAARFGGEEFLVLLIETVPQQALATAERIRRRVTERFPEDGEHSGVSVSIGVASFPVNGDDTETIIHEADEALYEAKRAGRNRVIMARNVPVG